MAERNFGRMIEDRRRELGLTQEMVAKKVGVKANYVGYLERGMRRPSQKVVERLSSALKLDSQDLYLLANLRVRSLLGKAPRAASSSQSLWQKFLRDPSLQQSQGLTSREKEALAQLATLERASSPASIARVIKALRRGFVHDPTPQQQRGAILREQAALKKTADAVRKSVITAPTVKLADQDTFFDRIVRGLGNRAWMAEKFVTTPFLVRTVFPPASVAELAALAFETEVSFDISPFVNVNAGRDWLSTLVFLGLYPSGAVRGISAIVDTVGSQVMVHLTDPLCLLDPDDSSPVVLTQELPCEISLVGLEAPDYV